MNIFPTAAFHELHTTFVSDCIYTPQRKEQVGVRRGKNASSRFLVLSRSFQIDLPNRSLLIQFSEAFALLSEGVLGSYVACILYLRTAPAHVLVTWSKLHLHVKSIFLAISATKSDAISLRVDNINLRRAPPVDLKSSITFPDTTRTQKKKSRNLSDRRSSIFCWCRHVEGKNTGGLQKHCPFLLFYGEDVTRERTLRLLTLPRIA